MLKETNKKCKDEVKAGQTSWGFASGIAGMCMRGEAEASKGASAE